MEFRIRLINIHRETRCSSSGFKNSTSFSGECSKLLDSEQFRYLRHRSEHCEQPGRSREASTYKQWLQRFVSATYHQPSRPD